MRYSLKRTRDGAGDSGMMSKAIVPTFDHDSGKVIDIQEEENARPRLGVAMRVGTPFSRSYANQDYWTTTVIVEILEESEHYVKFRTGNSVYEWKEF